MVARGNNRNNGSNLGIAYLNANNALSNSNGSNWRSRPPLLPVSKDSGQSPALNLQHHSKRLVRALAHGAVKYVHERLASMARQASRTATAPKGWRQAA